MHGGNHAGNRYRQARQACQQGRVEHMAMDDVRPELAQYFAEPEVSGNNISRRLHVKTDDAHFRPSGTNLQRLLEVHEQDFAATADKRIGEVCDDFLRPAHAQASDDQQDFHTPLLRSSMIQTPARPGRPRASWPEQCPRIPQIRGRVSTRCPSSRARWRFGQCTVTRTEPRQMSLHERKRRNSEWAFQPG